MSPASTAIEAVFSARMMSEERGDAKSVVQHVLTAAVGKRYSGSAVGAHLEFTLFDAARQQHGRLRPFLDA